MSRTERRARSGLPASASIFAALGDETRLRLIAALCVGGTLSISQLTHGAQCTRQAVTKHLDVLASAGLVSDTKVGRERLWQLERKRLVDARQFLDAIAARWDSALLRLKAAVEA